MKQDSIGHLVQTVGFAAVSGMRSMFAPAYISHQLSNNRADNLKQTRLNFIQIPLIASTLKVLAVGELIGDKLPQTGDRIAAPQLIGRGGAGALVGASMYKAERKEAIAGAIIGAAAAIGATYLSFYARKKLVKKTGLPDFIWALVEDALAVGALIVIDKYKPLSKAK